MEHEWIDVATLQDTQRVLYCLETGEKRYEPFAPVVMLWHQEDKQ
jgi:hypothetical protein